MLILLGLYIHKLLFLLDKDFNHPFSVLCSSARGGNGN